MSETIKTNRANKAVSSTVKYSSYNVVYRSNNGLYRGFVQPYGITYEAETKNKVVKVLREMVALHEEALKRYNSPSHLKHVPLSYEEDIEKFNKFYPEISTELNLEHSPITRLNYYAEAKLPA